MNPYQGRGGENGEQHDRGARQALGRCPDDDRGAAAHGCEQSGRRRGPDTGRHRVPDLVGVAGARRCARRGPREARCRPGGHRRDHARQPSRVPHRRPGGRDARSDAILDLRHVSSGGDSLSLHRRRHEGGVRRAGVSARDARSAQRPARARASDPRGRGRAAGHLVAGGRRRVQPGVRCAGGRRRDHAPTTT